MPSPADLLRTWVVRQADAAAGAWFETCRRELEADPSAPRLFRSIGFATRRLGRSPLALSEADLRAAIQVRPGWRPNTWSVDTAARVALLLQLGDDADVLAATVERLCTMAEMRELVAYYQGLPLYPDPPRFRARAAEGLRTNMQTVFEAVAHHNPYPAEQLDEGAWNQMVLKALFIGSRLAPIQGLEARANVRLSRMLCDYARERWAAKRPVSPELWRCVGAAADEAALADLERALADDDPRQRQAAALALADSDHPTARVLLASVPDLQRQIDDGSLSWDEL